MAHPGTLSASAVERGMRISVLEGLSFALMVGLGEVFFLADAIRLSATPFEQGLVVILPLFLGSLGPLAALRVLGRLATRKPLVVAASAAQAAALVALALTDALGVSSPTSVIVCAAAYQVFGQSVGTVWASWFGDLVPGERRGSYFARRNRGIYLVTSLGLVAGGLALHALEPLRPGISDSRGGGGFVLIFSLAALARLVSSTLHAVTPEPRFQRPYTRVRIARFLRTRRGTNAWRVLVGSALLYFAVYLAGPYFTPFMLEDLSFGYLEFTAASLVVVLLKVLFLPGWGLVIGQAGTRPVFLLTALMTALIPLPWLWAHGLGWVLVAEAFSGLSWAGFDLALFCLLVERGYRGVRPYVFAVQTVLNGAAQLLGGLVGALLVGPADLDIRTLFGLSLVGRALVALGLPRLVRAGAGEPAVPRGQILLRVIGMRPAGGLGLRPLPPPPPGEG